MSEMFNPNYVHRDTDPSSPPPPLENAPPRNKGGRPKGSKNLPKHPYKAPQAKIERTAGITTYSPRVEAAEVRQAPLPEQAGPEKPQLRDLPMPQNPGNTPDASRSQGQFSLRRLVIQNYFTKQTRRLSVPFHKHPLDYLDRTSEVLLKQEEAVYWSENQRDAELKAFATLIDPLAGNKNPHATKPPQELTDNLVNMTE